VVGGGTVLRTPISDERIWRVMAYAQQHCCLRDRIILRILLLRGPRTDEVCTIKVEDVDFEYGKIHLFDSKKKIYVDIPIDYETLSMIEKLQRGRHTDYLFKSRKRRSDEPLEPNSLYRHIQRIGLKAGVERFSPREFRRHLAAFWLQKAHGDLGILQVILRHSKAQVTWEYANQFVFDDDIQKETDRVTDLMLERGNRFQIKKEMVENDRC
jgi:integrase